MTVDEFVNSIVELEAENAALRERLKAVEELVDGALAIVEIWDAPSVYQIKWKQEWIEKARQAIQSGGKP